MARPEGTKALVAVTVTATLAVVFSVSLIVITLATNRPVPPMNTLLVLSVVLAVAGGLWVRFSTRVQGTSQSGADRTGATLTHRFTNPRAWSGLPKPARLTLAGLSLVAYIVAASSNPLFGGYHNDPSLHLCGDGRSGGPACATLSAHLHALAAHQRFFAAVLTGVCILVIGSALSQMRSPTAIATGADR